MWAGRCHSTQLNSICLWPFGLLSKYSKLNYLKQEALNYAARPQSILGASIGLCRTNFIKWRVFETGAPSFCCVVLCTDSGAAGFHFVSTTAHSKKSR